MRSTLLFVLATLLVLCVASSNAEGVSNSLSVARACPSEAFRRINLCQKILREYFAPTPKLDDPQIVPESSSWSSSKICSAIQSKNVDYDNCQKMAAHLYGAAGGTAAGILYQNRATDIHDTCVRLLTRPFPINTNMRYIDVGDTENCSLKTTGGITGLRCLFLHGMGSSRLIYRGDAARDGAYIPANTNDGWLAKWPRYWNTETALDGICDVRYYVTETTMRPWTDDATQREYCAAIDRFNPHVIFTHSMGNMIIGAAIFRNLQGACQRINPRQEANSITWFTSQAPWLGSPLATSTIDACEVANSKGGVIERLKNAVIRKLHPCGKELAALSINPYLMVEGGNPTFGQLRATGASFSSGSLCGVGAKPLTVAAAFTKAGMGLWRLAKDGDRLGFVDWGPDSKTTLPPAEPISGNDGFVNWASCGFTNKNYMASPESPHYAVEASHQDGTCFIPDRPTLGASKQPCSWYVLRVSSVRARVISAPVSSSANVWPVSKMSWYLPFEMYTYPKSFLEMSGYMSFAEMEEAKVAAEEEAKAKRENDTEADRSNLEAEASAVVEVVRGPAEISLEKALAFLSVDSQAMVDAEADAYAAAANSASAAAQADAEAVAQLEEELAEMDEMLEEVDPSAD